MLTGNYNTSFRAREDNQSLTTREETLQVILKKRDPQRATFAKNQLGKVTWSSIPTSFISYLCTFLSIKDLGRLAQCNFRTRYILTQNDTWLLMAKNLSIPIAREENVKDQIKEKLKTITTENISINFLEGKVIAPSKIYHKMGHCNFNWSVCEKSMCSALKDLFISGIPKEYYLTWANGYGTRHYFYCDQSGNVLMEDSKSMGEDIKLLGLKRLEFFSSNSLF
jgi:hypothetical protein